MKKIIIVIFILSIALEIFADDGFILNGVYIPKELYKEIKNYVSSSTEEIHSPRWCAYNQDSKEIEAKLLSQVKHNKKAYCQFCNINYPVADYYSEKIDIDCRFPYDSRICIDGLPIEVTYILPPQCPLCGLIANTDYYSPVALGQMNLLWHAQFLIEREKGDLWKHYEAPLLLIEHEHNSEELFRKFIFFLKASRSVKNDKIKRKDYIKEAFEYLDMHIRRIEKNDDFFNDYEKRATLILKADILRQMENFEEAASLTSYIRKELDSSYTYSEILLDVLDDLIQKKNNMPALKPFGNKLHIAIHENKPINSEIEQMVCDKKFIKTYNINQMSPLMVAIIEKKIEYIKLLTTEQSLKLLVDKPDCFVIRRLEVAKRTGNKEIYEIVRSAFIREGYIDDNEKIKGNN